MLVAQTTQDVARFVKQLAIVGFVGVAVLLVVTISAYLLYRRFTSNDEPSPGDFDFRDG